MCIQAEVYYSNDNYVLCFIYCECFITAVRFAFIVIIKDRQIHLFDCLLVVVTCSTLSSFLAA